MARTWLAAANNGLYNDTQIVAAHPFCMGAWFKTTSTTSLKQIVYYGNGASASDYHFDLRVDKTTSYVFCRDTGQVPEISVIGSTAMTDGLWHHAMVNYWTTGSDPSITYNIELYVDGSLIGSSNIIDDNTHDTPANSTRYAIGRRMSNTPTPSSSFSGQLAEAVFGKRRITANEAVALYRGANPIRVLGTDLVRYHPLPGYAGGAAYATDDGNNWFAAAAQMTQVVAGGFAGANHPPVQPLGPFVTF